MPPRRAVKEEVEAERRRIEQQKQEEVERLRNVELFEIEARQNSLRAALLGDSQKKIDELLRNVRNFKKSTRSEAAWQKYLQCENIPDTNVPAEVRDFLHRWRESLMKHWEQKINWWLKCNDRSVLTQDPSVEDERRFLIRKLREKTGKFYDVKLREMFKLYNSLMDSLRRRKMTAARYEDLTTIRDEIRETTFKFLDVLTLEVTMHIDREMNSLTPWTSSYLLATPDFVKYVWSFKDVPPTQDKKIRLIKMDPLNLTVTASKRFNLSVSSLRGLWFKQDFFSDHCPSFFAPLEMKFESLKSAVAYERHIRSVMKEKRLEEMQKVRIAWEEKIEKKRLEEEKSKKADKGKKKPAEKSKKSNKKVKEISEPPVVDDKTFVDVEEEYCAFEFQEFMDERTKYLPENLGLGNNEVNMRERQIINGILELESFERPLQTKEINPELFIRLNEHPVVLKVQEFHQDFIILEPKKNDRKSQAGKVLIDPRQKALDQLMKVELKLSDKFFWFETPIACRWEPWEESDEFNELDKETQDYNLRYEEHVKNESEKLFSAHDPHHFKKVVQLDDFDLNSDDRKMKLSTLFKHYIVPTIPDEYKCFNEHLEIFEKKQRDWQMVLQAKENLSTTSDFTELFKETGITFNVEKITAKEFDKIYDEKLFYPRSLFPREYRNLIEVLKGSDVSLSSDEPNEENITMPVDGDKPDKNSPFLLSELVKQIERVKGKLRPVFPEILTKITIEVEVEQPKELRESRFSWRENKASRIAREFREGTPRLPSRSRSRKSKTTMSASAKSLTATSSDTETLTNIEPPSVKTLHKLIPHHKGKWSTRDVHEQSYDKDTKTLTFYAGRLGTFGLSTRKYVNLPFKSWEMFPVDGRSPPAVKLRIETQQITIEFEITDNGYTFQITHPRKVPFSGIESPIKDFELKKLLTSLNLNLFPEIDADCYVKDNCEKHKAMEFHTYKSMAVYCLSHNFKSSAWNRFADRRVAIFESRMITKSDFKRTMVTPLKTASVNVREECTPLDIVKLDYEFVPPDQEFHPDLLDFLKDDVDSREQRRNADSFMTTWFVQALLMNLQPLSFSR